MSFWETALLGLIAGSTIFVGLPIARLRRPKPRLRAFLNAASAGILLFLLLEIFEHAFEPLEETVEDAEWGATAAFGALFVIGLGVGLLSLLYLTRWQRNRRVRQSIGPGAMAVAETAPETAPSPLHLGMSIAAGIGLHNFSEGLAIGQSAALGEINLAILLVVGFALHNATEGFGIVGPLAAGDVRPSWPYLLVAGLVGGGPTFIGTLVGTAFASEYVSVLFLTLAAGAIIYVVAELLNVGRRLGAWDVTMWGLIVGFVVAMGTELVIVAAGG